MSVQVERLENSTVKLTIEVPETELEKALQDAYNKQKKSISIPGFRKGKVPRAIVEKMYGPEIFYNDAADALLPPAYSEAAKECGEDIMSRPTIDIVQIEKGKPFIFTAEVAVRPEVKLGDYKGIEVTRVDTSVSDEEVEEAIERERERNGRDVTVEDRAIEDGDTAVIDYEGFVDGVAFDGGSAKNQPLKIGSGTFIPGFEEQLIGKNAGDDTEVNVTFPEDYHADDLAGKDATFKVKLHEIKRKELPKIDDEFAKDVSEFDTLKELKDSVKEKLQTEAASKAKYENEEKAIKAVCDATKIDIPSGMIETEIDNMMKDIETRLSYQGLNMKQYLQMIGKSEEEMRKEFEEQAKTSVKSRLVLEAVVKAEKIEASIDEISEKIKEMAANYGRDAEELQKNEHLVNYIKENMTNEKAIKFIVDNAKMAKATK